MTPYFEYSPIKVTFKKKVRLRDLTPEKEDKDLFWAMIGAASLGFGTCLGIILLMAWIANHIPKNW
jgi:hypothetical protein